MTCRVWRRKQKPGGPILRHEHRKEPVLAQGDPELLAAIEGHVEEHFGEVDRVWHELVSAHVHVDVLVVEPAPDRPVKVLVTCGMSEQPMQGRNGPRWGELMLMVPPDFELFDGGRAGWPLTLLQSLAHIPHDFDTVLWAGHTVPNGDPAEPYASSTALCCALLGGRMLKPEAFDTLTYTGRDIDFLAVYPLDRAEMEFKLQNGSDALFDRLDASGVTEILKEGRASVV
jgi:hypothetical protein